MDLIDRTFIGASATLDVALRTGVASALCGPIALSAIRGDIRAELPFYAELAAGGDADITFPAPRVSGTSLAIRSSPTPPFTFSPPGGSAVMLSFDSPFEAVNPAVRDRYASHRENSVAWAQHWRHDDGPRPTLAVIHGFGASPYWFNSAFFCLPELYREGYDILLYLLPFHGVRQAHAAFSGWGLFANGLAGFIEAVIHAVHDFRLFMDHLEATGVERIAVTGLSLGGYVTSLIGTVDPRPVAVIPNVPVVDTGRLFRQWFPASLTLAVIAHQYGIPLEQMDGALAATSPLGYAPRVAHARRMIIGGLGDRLAPPEQAELLWEHWGRPRVHWFPGSHLLHAGRGRYQQEMRAFLRAHTMPERRTEAAA